MPGLFEINQSFFTIYGENPVSNHSLKMMPFRPCRPVSIDLASLWLILALTVAASAAGSPEKPLSDPDPAKESESSPSFTLKVPVNTVLVNVTVTDKAGQPVADLTVDDFKLYEDGKRQEIQSFEMESGGPIIGPEPADPASGQSGGPALRVGSQQDARGEQARLFSCFIDDLTSFTPRYYAWTLSALKKFVAEEMGPQDQVGIFSASGNVRIPYTSDRTRLQDQLEDLKTGKLELSRPFLLRRDPESFMEQIQAAIRRLLASLDQHLLFLQHVRANKTLVLLSEGFVPQRALRWRLDRLIDQALRSRVTLNTVDMKGLHLAKLGRYRAELERYLEKLAVDTGGIYFRGSNDLLEGLRQIHNAQTFYYVLSYAAPDQAAIGKYHRIKVEVGRPGLTLRHRKGYFAPRERLSPENRKNKDLQLALEAPVDFNQIPIQLDYESSRLDEDRYRLSVLTHVRIEEVQFLSQEGRHRNLLHLVVMAYDEDDEHVEGSEQKVELNLSKASYLTMLRDGFTSKTDMELAAGQYRIKAIVREGNQTRMGSLEERVELPIPKSKTSSPVSIAKTEVVEVDRPSVSKSVAKVDAADGDLAEEDLIPSPFPDGMENSNLVLSQHLTPLADLSPDVQQSLLEDSDSLIFKDVLILPPMDDQIDRHYPVTICYRLYNLNYPDQAEGMTARIQLTDETGRVSRFPLIPLGKGKTQSRRSGTVDVAFNLSFKNVQPGRYKLRLLTRAPAAGRQAASFETTIMVVE